MGCAASEAGMGEICEVDAGAGCRDSTGCCAAALTEASSAAVNINFEVRILFLSPVSFNRYQIVFLN
jgi:hypothetical protein